MAEVILFHHAQGQTEGFLAFADELRAAGHIVHTPDLYEGRTFATLDAGVHHGDEELGMDTVIERAAVAVENLPTDVVYAGFSLGAVPSQALTQTRPGAQGALLLEGCVPPSSFDAPWPTGVPVQIHGMDRDEWFELDVAESILEAADKAELFLYSGDRHLFADPSLSAFDPAAAALMTQRVLRFLAGV
jgi:dienelactone hydrolase